MSTINNSINAPFPIAVADGGTGNASLTAYAVVCGGTTATGALQSIASVGTSGQVLTSNGAAALPTFQPAAGGGTTWTNVSTSTSLAPNNGYFVDSTSGEIQMTLPVSANVGDTYSVVIQAGGTNYVVIVQNSGQSIQFGNSATAVSYGSIAATTIGNTLQIVCSTTNTNFFVVNAVGTWTVQ